MTEIEWQADTSFEPAELSVQSFCQARRLPLPQPVEGSLPLVFLTQAALEALNTYLESDLSREHGGVLAGLPYRDPGTGRDFVEVRAAIPAIHSEGSPVHMQFNAEAWEYISGLLEENFPGQVILGWYHSHPGLGVFMSGTDRSAQRAFYRHAWSLALVVDPISREAGWFAGPECAPLGESQVILVERSLAAQPAQAPDRSRAPLLSELRWLLPVALLCLAAIFLLLAAPSSNRCKE